MGLKRIRVDSVKELKTKKTNEELTKENEQLKQQVADLEAQTVSLSEDLTNTQLALCDVYEMMTMTLGGE